MPITPNSFYLSYFFFKLERFHSPTIYKKNIKIIVLVLIIDVKNVIDEDLHALPRRHSTYTIQYIYMPIIR